MKKVLYINAILFFAISIAGPSFSEENKYNLELEFGSSPAERVLQFLGIKHVKITGYSGNKVLLSSTENIFQNENDTVNEKAKGLIRIRGGGFKINNNKQKNILTISSPPDKNINLDVKVPNNITIKFGNDFIGQAVGKQTLDKSNNNVSPFQSRPSQTIPIPPLAASGISNGIIGGEVSIKDFSGIVEASTLSGSIIIENIEGEIIANAVSGNINIIFKKLKKDRSLYFSTVSGDIDVTFPKDTDADIMISSVQGEIYSGFAFDLNNKREATEEKTKPQTADNINTSNYILTKINNGGQKIYLNTISGTIYIRKGN
jgi:hypothetical protein